MQANVLEARLSQGILRIAAMGDGARPLPGPCFRRAGKFPVLGAAFSAQPAHKLDAMSSPGNAASANSSMLKACALAPVHNVAKLDETAVTGPLFDRSGRLEDEAV